MGRVGLAQANAVTWTSGDGTRQLDMLTRPYLDTIKSFEGFETRAKWDYAQFTNGYGTKAQHPSEQISREEADRRFKQEIAHAATLVDRFAPNLDSGTRAALTSLTFNAGTKWMAAGLGEAIKSGNLEEGRKIFLQYNKAGGEVLPGLVRRRLEESAWFGDDQAANGSLKGAAEPTTGDWKTLAVAAMQAAPPSNSGLVEGSDFEPAFGAATFLKPTSVEMYPIPSEAQALIEQVILEQWRMMALELRSEPTKEDERQS
jgi:lysozyme